MKKYIKKYQFGIIVGVAFITITLIIPYVINKVMYLPIKTNSTSDSDWLAFWGSFLGGVFGGFLTLTGVRYTIKENEKEKEKENEKNKPFIVPLKNTILVYRDVINETCYLSNQGKDENFFIYEQIYFKLINLGKEHAFNLSLGWNPPETHQIENFLQQKHIDNRFKKGFNLICNSRPEKRDDEIQIIKSCDNQDVQETYLFVGWESLIKNLIECIALTNKGNKNDKTYVNMPLGKLELKYENIYGNDVNKIYSIYGQVFQGIIDKDMESYYLSFKFNLEDPNN